MAEVSHSLHSSGQFHENSGEHLPVALYVSTAFTYIPNTKLIRGCVTEEKSGGILLSECLTRCEEFPTLSPLGVVIQQAQQQRVCAMRLPGQRVHATSNNFKPHRLGQFISCIAEEL